MPLLKPSWPKIIVLQHQGFFKKKPKNKGIDAF